MAPPLSEDHEGSVERNTSPSPLPTTGKKRERSQTPYYPNKNPRLRRLSTPPSPPLPPSPTLVTSAPSHEDQLSSSQGETIIADSEDGYSELDEDACLAYLTDEVSEQASSEPDPSSEHDTNTGYKEVYIVDPSTGHILPIWRRELDHSQEAGEGGLSTPPVSEAPATASTSVPLSNIRDLSPEV